MPLFLMDPGCPCCTTTCNASGCVNVTECVPSGLGGQVASNVNVTVWQDGMIIGSGYNLGPCPSGIPPGSGVTWGSGVPSGSMPGCLPYCFPLPSGSDPIVIIAQGGQYGATASGTFNPANCVTTNSFSLGFGGLYTFHIRVNNTSTCTTFPIWFNYTVTATDPNGNVLGSTTISGGVGDLSVFISLPLAGPTGTPVTLTFSQNSSPRYASSFSLAPINAAPCGQTDVPVAFWPAAPGYAIICCRDPIKTTLQASNALGAFTLTGGTTGYYGTQLVTVPGTNFIGNGECGMPGSCEQDLTIQTPIGWQAIINTCVGQGAPYKCAAFGWAGGMFCNCCGPQCFNATHVGDPANGAPGSTFFVDQSAAITCPPLIIVLPPPTPDPWGVGQTTITE